MQYREIIPGDIPALFEVRTSTDENHLSLQELESMGITEESVRDRLAGSFKGWLCEGEGRVQGFAMGDSATGEMWVIAVRPEQVKRGIGTELLGRVEDWLRACGCHRLWLTTDIDPSLRAYSFYLRNGWEDDGIKDGLRYMKKEGRAQ